MYCYSAYLESQHLIGNGCNTSSFPKMLTVSTVSWETLRTAAPNRCFCFKMRSPSLGKMDGSLQIKQWYYWQNTEGYPKKLGDHHTFFFLKVCLHSAFLSLLLYCYWWWFLKDHNIFSSGKYFMPALGTCYFQRRISASKHQQSFTAFYVW